MTTAERICEAIEDLFNYCLDIKEAEKCDTCPMKTICLEENDFITIADLIRVEGVNELIEAAYRC